MARQISLKKFATRQRRVFGRCPGRGSIRANPITSPPGPIRARKRAGPHPTPPRGLTLPMGGNGPHCTLGKTPSYRLKARDVENICPINQAEQSSLASTRGRTRSSGAQGQREGKTQEIQTKAPPWPGIKRVSAPGRVRPPAREDALAPSQGAEGQMYLPHKPRRTIVAGAPPRSNAALGCAGLIAGKTRETPNRAPPWPDPRALTRRAASDTASGACAASWGQGPPRTPGGRPCTVSRRGASGSLAP